MILVPPTIVGRFQTDLIELSLIKLSHLVPNVYWGLAIPSLILNTTRDLLFSYQIYSWPLVRNMGGISSCIGHKQIPISGC